MRITLLAVALLAAGTAVGATPPMQADPALGRWSNPKSTLTVETRTCDGDHLCGEIVWAGPAAITDARDAGVGTLVGTQLLRDYRRSGPGRWNGRVYVPDMGRSFSSRISQTSPDTLSISGCLIGGWFCKTQAWHRVP